MKDFVRIFFVLLMASILVGCSAYGTDNIPQPSPLVNFKPSKTIKKNWSASVGPGTGSYYLKLEPALDDGVIYTPNADGQVTATNTSDGVRIWQKNLHMGLTSGAAVCGDMLLICTDKAFLIALSKKDGHLLWEYPLPNEVLAAPLISGSHIIIKTIDGYVIAINSADHSTLWTHKHEATPLILHSSSKPATHQHEVYAGFEDGKIAALNLRKGNLLWQRAIAVPKGVSEIDSMVDIDADPVTSDSSLYVATYQGNIMAISLPTGEVEWQHQLSSYTGLAIGADAVFVTDADSNVWAFQKDSGRVLWKQDKLAYRFITAPKVMGNAIVIGDSLGYVHWLAQSNGSFLARVQADQTGIIAAPIVKDNALYALSKDGVLARYTQSI